MPLYDYQCTLCHWTFDKLVSMDQRDDAQECPQCEGKAYKKAVNTFATTKSSSTSEPSCFQGGCCTGCKHK